MSIKKVILTVLVALICVIGISYVLKQPKVQTKESTNLTSAAELEGYTYTAQVLREHFNKDPEYVSKFVTIAKNSQLNLDPLFLGQKDSKPFTENQNGYTDAEKSYGIEVLKAFVAQQFPYATPSTNPTYTVVPGAPGAGKTYALQHAFNIDIANGKFAQDSITVGPDLVVMSQLDAYKNACTLPIGADRTTAMKAAYSHDRDLSNAVANFMLVMAMTDGLNIKHDTNLSATTAPVLLDTLGKLGYTRIGRVLMVEKVSRAGALEERAKLNGGFALVTTSDALTKGVALYERIADGSYVGRFEELVFCVQEPEFYLGKGKIIEVARYNPQTGKVHVLPGAQQHLDNFLTQAKAVEGLNPELMLAFEQAVNAWERAN